MVCAMRVLDAFRMKGYADAVSASLDPSTLPIASPWAGPSGLAHIAVPDIFGNVPVNTRASAMRLAPTRRARNLLVSTIARFPLVQLGLGESVPRADEYGTRAEYREALRVWRLGQPTWMYRTDDGSTPQHRMVWTVDDLIFHPASLWWAKRGSDGFPLSMGRVNRDEWTINADNRVEVHGQVVSDEQVVLIPGFSDGILRDGADVLRDARTIADIVRKRLRNPGQAIDLHQTSGTPLNREEQRQLVADYVAARATDDGNVGYSNQFIEPKMLGGDMDSQLMIEGRNASAVDQARLVGVAASRIDASGVNSTLTYETTQGRNGELVDFDLSLYTLPIEARLSLDDCVPAGSRTAFDMHDFIEQAPSVTGAERGD